MHLELAGIWKPAFSLWYSIKPAALAHLLPAGFKLYCRNSRAFCNIFISRMEYVRPAGLPFWCGIHGWQINYCTYVASAAEASGEVKGLYVVRSLIERKHFSRVSSVMPYFHFQPASIQVAENQLEWNFEIRDADHKISFTLCAESSPDSFRSHVFRSLSDAMNFLQHRNTYVLTSGDFLEFGDLHFAQNGKRISGPTSSLEFHEDLKLNEFQLELAAKIDSAAFHLILGRRERPAPVAAFAEVEF